MMTVATNFTHIMSRIPHSKLDAMQTIPLLNWGLLVLRKHEKSILKEAKTEIELQLLGLASVFNSSAISIPDFTVFL